MKLYVYACDVEMNNEDHQEDSPSIEVLFLTYLISLAWFSSCFHLLVGLARYNPLVAFISQSLGRLCIKTVVDLLLLHFWAL